jgi:cobalt/nickel transport system permease protein
VISEELARGDSPVHRLDPRVKLLATLLYSVVIAVAPSLTVVLAGLPFVIFFLALSRLSVKKLALRFAVVNGFIAFLWLIIPFTTKGNPVFSIGPLVATDAGLMLSLLITLKSNAIIGCVLWGLATTRIFDLAHSLMHLKVPGRLVHLIFLTHRYLFVVLGEFRRLRVAMKMRGFTPGTNLHTYRSYANLVGMLLVNSFDRSERVYKAMKLRGYEEGELWLLKHFHFGRADVAVLAFSILYVGGLVFLAYAG